MVFGGAPLNTISFVCSEMGFVYIFAIVFRWIASARLLQKITRQRRVSLAPQPRQPRPLKNRDMTEEMRQVADLITANTIFCTKEILTSDEAAKYMGISKSYLYKLTMRQQIPHYKPMGKMCYFNRLELEQWLQSNRVSTATELTDKAMAYTQKKRVKR